MGPCLVRPTLACQMCSFAMLEVPSAHVATCPQLAKHCPPNSHRHAHAWTLYMLCYPAVTTTAMEAYGRLAPRDRCLSMNVRQAASWVGASWRYESPEPCVATWRRPTDVYYSPLLCECWLKSPSAYWLSPSESPCRCSISSLARLLSGGQHHRCILLSPVTIVIECPQGGSHSSVHLQRAVMAQDANTVLAG